MVANDNVDGAPSPLDDGNSSSSSSSGTLGGASSPTSNDQWRVFLGLAILVAAFIFRIELVRFSLRLVRRAMPGMFVWINEFEKNLLKPLSWVVLILLIWLSMYVMDLSAVLGIEAETITSIVTLVLGFPLIWVVICFCNYVTWVRYLYARCVYVLCVCEEREEDALVWWFNRLRVCCCRVSFA